ncbi:MAG TPA: Cof-type HAD-IIB family hydrolase [Clostridiales bacterium]|jgi:cof-like hydrolase|nr:Cof-type HAD-IIB family hydrolase [Clostridium sp.]MEE1379562.1 Cof-type HAD-IIB family hydrolase [Clostridia bacterium]CDE55947.1 cof-like hydrolase [Clostridium sp. CAG:269]HCQ56096.1 Cof-type HAD-IIB family hydrolase [Clostridiales bacterium]
MYKLVAIDLDGTMLNQYGIITEKTKKAISKAQEKGVEVMIASGRAITSVKRFSKEINSNKYFISGNGAITYDIKNNKILYENILSKTKALKIIKICEENSIYYNVYTENGIIAKNLSYNTLYYYKDNLTKPDENRTHINIVENVYDYFEQREEKILKIMICDEHKTVFNSIVRKLKELSEIEVLEVSHMSRKIIKQGTDEIALEYFYTEVSAKDVDKWNALEEIIGLMNISKEEVVTIGDNANDLKMITNAGLGVAMGESAPYVKQSADIIAPTNDEDGVAIILNKIFDLNL